MKDEIEKFMEFVLDRVQNNPTIVDEELISVIANALRNIVPMQIEQDHPEGDKTE